MSADSTSTTAPEGQAAADGATSSGGLPGGNAIVFDHVSMTFPDGTEGLSDVNLAIAPGEFVSIVGPSGCGKSTLLKVASGLVTHTGGKVWVDRDQLGYTFQDATLLPWRKVQDNVELLMELRDFPAEERCRIAAEKIELVNRLSAAGLRAVEAGSFVSPKWVPQMADSAEVLAGITRGAGISYAALTPNMKGYEGAKAARADEIAVFASASEGFSTANLNCSVAESIERFLPILEAAKADGIPVRGYISCVTDCPFDGPTPPGAVAALAEQLLGLGCYEVSLGDTIGKATPETLSAMLKAVTQVAPAAQLAGHYHDTSGRACDNIEASLGFGLRVFDAAVGGLGGCPYAPGAQGNVATEAAMDRLESLGYSTGLDRAVIDRAAQMARSMRALA